MALILVIEREQRYIERIQDALSVEGYRVHFVGGRAEALQAAASEAPDLVIASAEAPGVEALAVSFARRSGGPGVVALMPESLEGVDAAAIEADEFLIKPFSDDDLRLAVRRALAARRDPARARVAETDDQQLTSKDIFGDVLAEVEDDLRRPAGSHRPPPPLSGFSAAGTDQGAIERKLEQTLSGVLGPGGLPRPKPPAPAAKKPAEMPDKDVEALLSKTLSSLQMGGRSSIAPRPAAPVAPVTPPTTPARPLPPPAPAEPVLRPPTPPVPAVPVPVKPTEATGVRSKADLDFAAIEQLARPSRPAAPAPPAASVVAPADAPPAPIAAPPIVPPAAPPIAPPAPKISSPEPLLRQAPVAAPAPPVPPLIAPPPAPTGATVEPANSLATQRIPVYTEEADDRRFGQYTLLERIAVGGMAEVWKARMRGLEGFQKTVAIKKILPHMTHNSEFVGMFIDEAKLAAQLSHPNIIHIYDLGKIANDYFIAMEYVEGRDLRTIGNLARQKRLPIPVGLSLLIAHHVAGALDHAHHKRDFEGHALGLVHRDVSPQNVLISRDGDIKLCDFGIAKAVTQAGQTQIGALKGKLQYMSPEQAWGRPVDARSDIFSLGTLLFEMLTGERLFAGDSEISVLEAVREGKVKSPREIDPSISAEIDAITRRALAHDPADRFQTAGEMEQRLGAVLYERKPTPSHTDLAAYVQRLEAAPIPEEEAEAPVAPAPRPAPVLIAPVVPLSAAAGAAALPAEPEAELEPTGPIVEAVAPLADVPIPPPAGRNRAALWIGLAALVIAAVAGGLWFARGKAKAPATPPAAESGPAPAAPAPAAGPAGAVATGPALQSDLSGLVDQAVAKRQEEMKKQFEEKERKLREKIASDTTAADKSSTATPPASAASSPAPVAPEPAPQPEERRPEPVPEPAKAEERRPEPPAPAAREEEAPRVREGDLVEPGPGVSTPQLVSAPKPGYPALAKQLGVQGVVVLAVLVDENGRVAEARLVEPIKQKVGINESALAAARGAQYRPATKGGVRVKMWTRLRIPFKL
ncbi:MAG TPA: TonB family protein [Thermoanaerobaculia bacterium]|jgi:TonB family protein|nr:TonB family protein [Thermoanaerobaculia bacterium]